MICKKMIWLAVLSPFDTELKCECGGELVLMWGAEEENV